MMEESGEDLVASLMGFPTGSRLEDTDHCKGCTGIKSKQERMFKMGCINDGGHSRSYSRTWSCQSGPQGMCKGAVKLSGSQYSRDLTKPCKGDPNHGAVGGKITELPHELRMSEKYHLLNHNSGGVVCKNMLSKTANMCHKPNLRRTKRFGNVTLRPHPLWYSFLLFILIFGTLPGTILCTIMEEELFDGSGEADGDRTVLVSVDTSGYGSAEYENSGEDVPYDSTQKARDVVDKFLSIVEQYEKNKENCTAGTGFNLGDGVVAQYGVRRFKQQALTAVNRANLLTRIWKMPKSKLHKSEYFFYTQVRNLLEGEDDMFAAGNCYDRKEFR